MRISILCSSKNHPIYPYLERWEDKQSSAHQVDLLHNKEDLSSGDILFLVSCNEIIKKELRKRFSFSLVIHASDLPDVKGWSPHIWQILEGKNEICVSLIEAEEPIDSGDIWKQEIIKVNEHELYDEINDLLFKVELKLMDFAVDNYKAINPVPQEKREGSYFRKRTPVDSEIDPNKTISEQFDLIRVSDPERFPAFFKLHGFTYEIAIKKVSNED